MICNRCHRRRTAKVTYAQCGPCLDAAIAAYEQRTPTFARRTDAMLANHSKELSILEHQLRARGAVMGRVLRGQR